MFKTWLKMFYRNSKKNWLNIFINVSGLAIGFACMLLVTLYLQDEQKYNKWLPEKENVYRVSRQNPNGDIWTVSSELEGPIYQEQLPEVLDHVYVRGMYDSDLAIYEGKKVFIEKLTIAEKGFFDFFPFQHLKGTPSSFSENVNAVALSSETAEQIFGKEDPIGKTIQIDDLTLSVSGVYQLEKNSYFEPQAVLQFPERMRRPSWGNYSYELFIRLKPDADGKTLEPKMDQILVENRNAFFAEEDGLTLEEFNEQYGIVHCKMESLSGIRLHTFANNAGPEGKGNFQMLMILIGLSILLIVISCVNFINLSTASAAQRAKEIGVKKTMGLTRSAIVFQYMMEVLFQSIFALLIAFLLVELTLPHFNTFIGKDFSIYNFNALSRIALISVAVALLVGLVPGIYLSKFSAVEVLRGNVLRSRSGVWVRNFMLGMQLFISGFFVIGVLVVYSQVNFMMKKDAGFNGEQVVVFTLNEREDRYKKYQLAKAELVKHPNITEVSTSLFVPGGGYINGTGIKFEGKQLTAATNLIDINYVDFADLKLTDGRALNSDLSSDTINNVMVNEKLIRELDIKDPIGKMLDFGWEENGKVKIVGVLKDYHFEGYDLDVTPMIFMPYEMYDWTENWINNIQVRIKIEDIPSTLAYMEEYRNANIEEGFPFDAVFLDKKFERTYAQYKQQSTMFFILSLVVVLISLLGLFALASLTMNQRLKEVAIRKVLGASVKDLVVHLGKSFVRITILSLVLLLPVSYFFMDQWLQNFPFRISMPYWVYVVAPIGMIIMVFCVVSVKALSATKVDLIKYLKFE